MDINIQAPWEVNIYLKSLIKEKLERLESVNNRIIHADVFLKKGVHNGMEDKVLEVRLRLPGPEVFAQAFAENYEVALADVADKLRRQLVRRKEKAS